MKRVILGAMIEAYPESMLRPDDEVWCCNAAFRHQKGVTRVYSMDDIKYFPPGYADELAMLPEHIRVIGTRHWPEIPRSEAYPILNVIRHFRGHENFVCTMAYMLAHAIYEGFDEIVLAGCYWSADSAEYMHHKACMDFWCGVAFGSDIHLDIWGPCSLCRPFQWEPALYGYYTNATREIVHDGLAAGYRFAVSVPVQAVCHVDPRDPDFDAKYGRPAEPGRLIAGEIDARRQLIADHRAEITRLEQQIRNAERADEPSSASSGARLPLSPAVSQEAAAS